MDNHYLRTLNTSQMDSFMFIPFTINKLKSVLSSQLYIIFTVVALLAVSTNSYAIIYYVTVKTGDVNHAGTNAKVEITLHGTTGEFGPYHLDTKDYDDFERGDLKQYILNAPDNLGRIVSVTMKHNASGSKSGWFLDSVSIASEQIGPKPFSTTPGQRSGKGDYYYFRFFTWITKKHGLSVTRLRDNYDPKGNLTGRIKGDWARACAGAHQCSNSVSKISSFNSINKTQLSDSSKYNISATINATKTFVNQMTLGFTGNLSAEYMTTHLSAVTRENKITYSESCNTIVDLTKFNIHAVWQFKITVPFGRDVLTIATCDLACTPDNIKPTVMPDHESLRRSCFKPL